MPVDVAPPPPPPPQVSSSSDWSNPYGTGGGQVGVSAPPLVAVSAAQPASTWDTWFGRGQQVASGLVDIFGRAVTPTGAPLQQPQHGLPLWGIVALGVGGIVVLGIAARSLRSRSYAGYKRKHRRSRR